VEAEHTLVRSHSRVVTQPASPYLLQCFSYRAISDTFSSLTSRYSIRPRLMKSVKPHSPDEDSGKKERAVMSNSNPLAQILQPGQTLSCTALSITSVSQSSRLTLLDLADVLLLHAWHAPVADDERAAHAAAVTRDVARLALDVDVDKLVDEPLPPHVPEGR